MFRHRVFALLSFLILTFNASAATADYEIVEKLILLGDREKLSAALQERPKLAEAQSAAGVSALMMAAYRERSDLALVIRAARRTISFHEACVVGDTVRVRELLAKGQAVDERSVDGFTPLGLAVFFRHRDVARVLMDAGADLNLKASNTTQAAPIHAAVARSDLKILEALLLRGASPNLPQQRMMRPLHEAAAAGNVPAVAMLLMFGADLSVKNEEGKSAADFARENGHKELSQRLRTG